MSPLAESRRLRIAILSRGFFSRGGGAENYSIALAEILALHHEVHVFTQHLDHHYPGIVYHILPQCVRRPSWVDLLCFSMRTWWETRSGFDIVHSHENIWHGQVQTVHVRPVKVGLFHERVGLRKFARYLQIATSIRLWMYLLFEKRRFSAAPGKAVIACSEVVQKEIESAYPVLMGKTHLLEPGVRLFPLVTTLEKSKLRQEFNIESDAFVLLFVGNDYAKKGLAPLLHSLQILPENVVLLVVGNGAHISKFLKLAVDLKVDSRVRFVGAVDSVTSYYQLADALVHPTIEDTFSMVVLEALASGVPVIVSNAGYCGIAVHLTHHANALILENPRSVEEISASVQQLQNSPVLRAQLMSAGREFAEKYSWEALAQRQEDIYMRVLAGCEHPNSP